MISSLAWLVFIVAGLWALKFLNAVLQSAFISLLMNSALNNLHWFFVASLATGYLEYFSRKFPPSGLALWPFSSAIGATFSAWILAWIFRAVGTMSSVDALVQIGTLLRANLLFVFIFFLAFGFISVAGRKRPNSFSCG